MKTIVKATVIAIALAIALSSFAEARSVTNNSANQSFVIGETDIDFGNTNGSSAVVNDCAAGSSFAGTANNATSSIGAISASTNFDSTTQTNLVAGTYLVTCIGGLTVNYFVSGIARSDSIKTYSNVAGKVGSEVSATTSGGTIRVNATTNLNDYITGCTYDLIVQKKGTTTNLVNASLKGLTIDQAGLQFSFAPTTDFPAGDYELLLDPSGIACNGVDVKSAVLKTVTVAAPGVTLKSDISTTALEQPVVLTLTGEPFSRAQLNLTRGDKGNLIVASTDASNATATENMSGGPGSPFIGAIAALSGECPVAGSAVGGIQSVVPGNATASIFCLQVKSSGNADFKVRMNKSGTYEFQAKASTGEISTVSIQVKDVQATVTTERGNYIVGEEVKIKGTTTAGTNAIIAINDRLWRSSTITNNAFEEVIVSSDTANFSPGNLNIKVWICPATVKDGDSACKITTGTSPLTLDIRSGTKVDRGICETVATAGAAIKVPDCASGVAEKGADATTGVLLQSQTLNLVSPTAGQEIATKDDITVKGTASGSTKVIVWIFNAQGTTSGGKCRSEVISVGSRDTGFAFEKKFGSEITDKSGAYTLVSQTLGRDRKYSDDSKGTAGVDKSVQDGSVGGTGSSFRCSDDSAVGSLDNKNGAQIAAILDKNAKEAGSDDFEAFVVRNFNVVSPRVTLDPCATAVTGGKLTVKGTSNRGDGTSIQIRAEGPQTLDVKTVKVANGSFSTDYDTTNISVGTYTVVADDLRGVTDTKTCDVIKGAPANITASIAASNPAPEVGENVTITVTIANAGEQDAADVAVKVTADGTELKTCDSAKVTAKGKGTGKVTCTIKGDKKADVKVEATATYKGADQKASTTLSVGGAVAPTATTPAAATPPPAAATPPTAATPAPTATPKPPGFEAVFAIAGLLAVAYIVARRKN